MRQIILVLLFAPVFAFAQQPLSLAEAIEIGLANNYQIRISQAAVAVAENNNDWSLAGKYPTINFNLTSANTYSRSDNPASVVVESQTLSNGLTPEVAANWVLFDGFRVEHTKAQLETQVDLSNEQLRSQVQNSVQSIIQAYNSALVQKEQLEVLDEVLALSRDRIEYQQVRQEFGQAGTFDLLQTQDAYLNDSTNYLIQLNSYQNALRSLNLAMGVTTGEQYTLSDELTFEDQAYAFDDLFDKMQVNNPDLKVQSVNQRLASINTNLQRTGRFPRVSLNAGLNYNVNWANGSQTFNFGGMPSEQDIPGIAAKTFRGFVNLTATYTLWDGGARNRRIESAQLQEIQSQLAYSSLEHNLRIQLTNTLATYNNQRDLVKLTASLVDNAQQNLTIAEERFRGGLINSFDYRTIQLNYINATQARLNAIFNLKNTETELIRLTGGLVR